MNVNWQQVAEVLSLALSTIDKIIAATRNQQQSARLDGAADALTVIGAIVDTVKSGKLDEINLAKAQSDLERLRSAIDKTDARIDDLVKKRFGDGPGDPGPEQK